MLELMHAHRLELTREQVLGFRRATQSLGERLPTGPSALREAARAGLQDSVPRSALHALHARVAEVRPDAWEDAALSQVWGLRYTAFVVPAGEHALFTLARLPESGMIRDRAEELAPRLAAFLAGRRLDAREAARGIGVHPNLLRYAGLTGTVLIRWDGARQPFVWTVKRPDIEPMEARVELARRYLRAMGPGTAAGFGTWAGLKPPRAQAAFDALSDSLVPVRTPLGEAVILAADEERIRTKAAAPAAARLLPSGDPFYLLQGADRELLVPDARQRAELWTSRVWPGALLVNGDVAGTWRRSKDVVTIRAWRRLSGAERTAVEVEAATLPIPEATRPASVRWETG
jgi:hypothetical protein